MTQRTSTQTTNATTRIPRQVRQGDVLIEETGQRVPAGAVPRARENGRVVLAHGEVTGHAHAVADQDAELYDVGDVMLLEVDHLSDVRHDEHGAVTLTPTTHEVIRQSEYTPAAIVNVGD